MHKPYLKHGYYARHARAAVLARVEIDRLLKRRQLSDQEWQRLKWWGERLLQHQIWLHYGRDYPYRT